MKALKSGFEVIFMAPQSRRHGGKTVIDAVADEAKALGIRRMTKRIDAESAGQDGHVHAAHFFELVDQPIELMYVLDAAMADKLVEAVDQTGIDVFCLCREVAYGQLGKR